jgi:methyl-accepting chemotaxis protein
MARSGSTLVRTIVVLPALAGLAFAVVLLLTVLQGRRSDRLVERIESAHFPAFELALGLESDLASLQQILRGAQASGSLDGLATADRTMAEVSARLAEARKQPAFDPRDVERLSAAFDAYYKAARLASEQLINRQAGEELTSGLDAMRRLHAAAQVELAAYKKRNREEMIESFADARQAQRQTMVSIGVLVLLAVAGLFFASRWVVQSVTRPLRQAVEETVGVAERWAEGDLTARVSDTPLPEVRTLLLAMDRMAGNLRKIIGETQSGANNLAGAASQILASTRRTAQGAQEQATAVQETTATASELQQTARVTEERAREMQEAMARSVEASQKIRAQLGDVAGAMARVREEMQTVMGQVQDLARRNLQIGEIIESVGEVADQTQLLAVNAAIEAAKAGDVGRGFSVVAGEMKALADQSKKASHRIRAIVSEVQQAATDTTRVAVTGQARLEDAIGPVSAVLPLVEQLTARVEESSGSLRQILAIVAQQIAGIGQISQAMRMIQGGVHEGVAQSAQLEQGAVSLDALGGQLRDLVSGYRLH